MDRMTNEEGFRHVESGGGEAVGADGETLAGFMQRLRTNDDGF